MKSQQQAFLEHIGLLIPKLFDAIRLGNVKSEYVLGDRIIGQRQVRLKLVAEVVDPGSNPLATHSQMREAQMQSVSTSNRAGQEDDRSSPPGSMGPTNPESQAGPANQSRPTPPRRGPRRKHPMSR